MSLIFLFCSSQVFGEERAEQDLLKAAIQETEVAEDAITKKESKRDLAEKSRHKTKRAKSTKSSSKQKYDFGDVVVTVSDERELEEAPEVYLQQTGNASTVLNVTKKPHRKTSSIKPQKQPQREPSSTSSKK